MVATLVARRTATILAHKTFLLELRDRIRLAALTDANARLEMLARTDPLTGVANRRSMIERLREFWDRGRAKKDGAAMLMCDVDDFKCLNDTPWPRRGRPLSGKGRRYRSKLYEE